MENTITFIFAMAISKVISIPADPLLENVEKCVNTGPSISETPADCCVIPNLMSLESITSCGEITEEHYNSPSLRGSADCQQSICVLRNNDLLFSNDEIDFESVKQFLDEFSQKYRKYLPAVNTVKERCHEKGRLGPAEWCEADKLIFCINSIFYSKCPDWLETEGCTNLRGLLEQCTPSFYT